MSSLFTIRAATVTYGRQPALIDIDLALDVGASLALVGPNGSGKTTLLNLLAGLATPRSGSVELQPGTTVAYVLQHAGHRPWMPLTVDEVLAIGGYRTLGLLGRRTRESRAAVAEAADRLGVSDLGARQFGELSGGQKQRVLVAQALAQGAKLLLMDEPITGLDMASQERILGVLDQETELGTTVVISTHNLDEAHHCEVVALLANRMVAVGPPEDVLQTSILRQAYSDDRFEAHRGHDHPSGVLLLDDHHHDHD
jgi:ABC-type Mn2+/Zn2+ transport system ATPase subunit